MVKASSKTYITKIIVCGILVAMLVLGLQREVPVIRAQSSTIIINEVFYDPIGADTGYEWIELKNISSEAMDLTSWKVEAAGSVFEERVEIPSFELGADEIVLIGEPLVEGADIIVPSLSFQNGGSETDGIRIINPEGEIIDTLLYDYPNTNGLPDDTDDPGESFAPDVASGSSLSRVSPEDTDLSGDDFVETETPTPGDENLIPPVADIQIAEPIYINTSITLDGSNSIDPDGQIVEWKWEIIDTEGDEIEIHGEIATHTFESEGSYQINLTVTDNDELESQIQVEIEVTEDPENPIITEISVAKTLDVGTKVNIVGTITAPVPCLYEKETYIQDRTGGIRIKLEDPDLIEFNKPYLLKGEISTTYGEKRLTVTEVSDTTTTYKPTPQILPPSQITPDKIGLLVKTEGKVTKTLTNYLYLDAGSESLLPVNFSKYTEVERPDDAKDKYLTVTGVVSRYGTNKDGSPKIRVMPRFEQDISISKTPSLLALTGTTLSLKLIIAAIFLFFSRWLITNNTL